MFPVGKQGATLQNGPVFFFKKRRFPQFLDLEVPVLTPPPSSGPQKRWQNLIPRKLDIDIPYGPFLGWKGRVAGPKVHCNRLDVATEGRATFW